MAKFRKKPVVIDAAQIGPGIARALPSWLADAMDEGAVHVYGDGRAQIATLEGNMSADIGDWIIKGVKGELYPCKPAIFEATYEPVDA